MNREDCSSGDKEPEIACKMCGSEITLPYWCETCQRPVAEKRCPCCGLKTRKSRRPGQCE